MAALDHALSRASEKPNLGSHFPSSSTVATREPPLRRLPDAIVRITLARSFVTVAQTPSNRVTNRQARLEGANAGRSQRSRLQTCVDVLSSRPCGQTCGRQSGGVCTPPFARALLDSFNVSRQTWVVCFQTYLARIRTPAPCVLRLKSEGSVLLSLPLLLPGPGGHPSLRRPLCGGQHQSANARYR